MKSLLILLLLAQTPTDKGIITGRILTADGKPASGIRVSAMAVPEGNGPAAGTVLESIAQTDSAGTYRLENVTPGRYYVIAGLVDLPTYFPGVTAQTGATVVTINAGTASANIDFSLRQPVQLKVSGKVVGAIAPQTVARTRIMMVPRAVGGGGIVDTQVNPDGTFEFLNVRPGTYSVQTVGGPSSQPQTITVADRAVTGIEVVTGLAETNTRREGLELAWSFNGTRVGVAGDTKTGLIYAITERPIQIVEIDLAGKLLRPLVAANNGPIAKIRIAHFAGDGTPALLAFSTWGADVRAFDANGGLLWSYPNPPSPGAVAIDDVNVGDLNGDNSDEVIIGFNGGTGVRVIDSKGQLAWQYTSIGNVWHVAAGYVLGQNTPQVITTSAGGKIHIFSNNGQDRKDLSPGFYANLVRVGRIPEAAGAATIFALGSTNVLAAVAGDGTTKWSLPLQSNITTASPTSAWLAKGKPWLAVSMRGGEVYVVDVERGTIIGAIDGQGAIVEVGWSANESNGAPLLLISAPGKLSAWRVKEKTQ